VHPAEETKLLLQVTTLERAYEAHKADTIEHEADETVLIRERSQVGIHKHDVLEGFS
jgi:hypothetical protein